MRTEKRKNVRRSVRQGAILVGVDGSTLGTCVMVNVSAGGARLVVPTSADLPDQFNIVLSRSGQLRRSCMVVWRSERTLGVRFFPSEWVIGR
jgi:PilZ domain